MRISPVARLRTQGGTGHGQGFGAEQVWFFATLLTIGYMVSRGLAKAGSREAHDRDARGDRH